MSRRKTPMMARNRRSLRRRSTGSAPDPADLDQRMHSPQVVAFEVAEEDVPAGREMHQKLPRVAHGEVRDLTDVLEQRRLLVDGEAVGAQWKLVRWKARSYHDEFVRRRASVVHVKGHRAGGDGRPGRIDPEVVDDDPDGRAGSPAGAP